MLKAKSFLFSTFFFIFYFFLFSLFFPTIILARTSPLIINRQSVLEFDTIPNSWLEQIRNNLKIAYGHTSHGSQIVTGMNMQNNNGSSSAVSCSGYSPGGSSYNYCDDYSHYKFGGPNNEIAPSGTLSFWDGKIEGASDLGNPNRTAWATATRNMLNDSRYQSRNLIIWSWCGQADTTSSNIDLYLNQMNQLENEFPSVSFVYMTGHLVGTGVDGNLNQRNQQIRDYCRNNNKILFDFADIESWDPNGTFYPNETDTCNWCSDWCSSHSCPPCSSCAHSHCFNCYQKGKAFWYMMAKLAGWEDGSASPTSPPSSCTPPCHFGNALRANGTCDNDINMSDYATWFREFFNNETTLYADFNQDGIVNRDDLPQWINKCYETGYGCTLN